MRNKNKDFFGLTDKERQEIADKATDEAIKKQRKVVVNFKNKEKVKSRKLD